MKCSICGEEKTFLFREGDTTICRSCFKKLTPEWVKMAKRVISALRDTPHGVWSEIYKNILGVIEDYDRAMDAKENPMRLPWIIIHESNGHWKIFDCDKSYRAQGDGGQFGEKIVRAVNATGKEQP